MKEALPDLASSLMQTGALLIDVREASEYEELHAKGAVLMPLSELESRYTELPQQALIMICRSGARSARATEFLLQNGYNDVTNLVGGTLAWAEAGLPTEVGHD